MWSLSSRLLVSFCVSIFFLAVLNCFETALFRIVFQDSFLQQECGNTLVNGQLQDCSWKTVTTHGTPELLLTVKAHSFESNEIMFGSMKRRALTSDDRHLDTTRSSGCESSLMLTLSLLV